MIVVRECTVKELNLLAANYYKTQEDVDRAKKARREAREEWKQAMELKENTDKYYRQFDIDVL